MFGVNDLVQLIDRESDPNNVFSNIVYQIGELWNPYFNDDLTLFNGREYLKDKKLFDTNIVTSVRMYRTWKKLSRDAIDTWGLCAKRLGFCRDLRKIIANFVWDTRSLGLYTMNESAGPSGEIVTSVTSSIDLDSGRKLKKIKT
jgi:hypothetical protein